jgi:hypothetical protein
MRGFELLQLAHQRVEFSIGDFRRSLDVVELFVSADFGSEFGDAFGWVHREIEEPREKGNREIGEIREIAESSERANREI